MVFSQQQPLAKSFQQTLLQCDVSTYLTTDDRKKSSKRKDAALALLNDELQAIQYKNVGLQGEIRDFEYE